MRLRAVLFALYYGLAPYPLYEAFCHYGRSRRSPGMSYAAHLLLNLWYAWRWARGRQSWGDVRFEVTVNRSTRRTAWR